MAGGAPGSAQGWKGGEKSKKAVCSGARKFKCACGAVERVGSRFALAPNVGPAALHARQALLRAIVGHVTARWAAAAQAASRRHQAGWANDAQPDATTHLFTAQPDGRLPHADHQWRETHHVLRATRILDIHVPPRSAAVALSQAVRSGKRTAVCGLDRVTRQLVVDR